MDLEPSAAGTARDDLVKQFAVAVQDGATITSETLLSVQRMCEQIKTMCLERKPGGISLYDLKNHELSAYLLNLSILISKMSLGMNIEGSSTVDQLVKLRVIIERMKPIERKMKTQVDRLLADGEEGAKELSMRARPELFDADSDDADDAEESDDEDEVKPQKQKKYEAPKMVPMHYDENADDKKAKQVERARKRAMQSSLIQDLRSQYSDAPTLIRDDPNQNRLLDEKRKFEEQNYVRIQLTKHEKRLTRRKDNIDTLDSLLKFGDYMAVDSALDGTQNKKGRGQKRRGPVGGKGKNKKRKH